ncbi:MAG: urease accessory protein UreD [Desulfitobacteriaceae bacterium]
MLDPKDLSNLPGKRGELKLLLGLKDGRTIIKESYNRVPLKVAKSFYLEPESGELFIYQMNPTGGMVQGDNYHLNIDLEKDARVFITTQAATKVYRTPESYASQITIINARENALLEYFPDPVIPFAGSRYVSEVEVHLAEGTTAFISDIISPGRTKSGEVFKFESYHSKTKVYWDENLILWDNWQLESGTKEILSIGRYKGYTHLGTFYIFSEKVSQDLSDKLHEVLHEESQVLSGVSLTIKNGIVVRLLGHRAADIEKAVMLCWDMARRELIGLPKPHIRKF